MILNPCRARALTSALLLAGCLFGSSQFALADVVFAGLDADQEANARALTPLASAACDTGRWRVERLFRDVDEDLRKALQALGYYDISISKTLSWTDDCWRADIQVTTGEPVRYRVVDVRIEGAALDNAPLLQQLQNGRPASGDILNHGEYERLKSSMLQRLSSYGYFEAEYTRNEVIVEPQTRSADLYLHVASGPRYRFGEVRFTQGILRDSLLQNYTDIDAGDDYLAADISKLYESLNDSGYFGSVSISTDPVDETTKTAPVQVSLTPGKRKNYSIGAGFATDTGPQGRAGYINRRRNDRGHQLETRLFGSEIKSEISTSYRWPKRDPRTEWFSIVAGLQHENTETSESDTFKLGVTRSKSVSSRWLETRYADFLYEDFTVGDQNTFSQLVILGISRESVIGRNIRRSERGRRIHLDLRGASDSLGSDTSFLQFRATAKWLWPLGPKTRLIARGKLGTTVKDALIELPASVRFFAGGDRSVRGYDFEALGPVDSNGAVTGGSHLLEAGLELDRLILRNWAIAVFADTGSAFNQFDPEFSTGVGLGIRWYSPVGPVRVDFAHPLDDPSRDFRLHISLGPDL